MKPVTEKGKRPPAKRYPATSNHGIFQQPASTPRAPSKEKFTMTRGGEVRYDNDKIQAGPEGENFSLNHRGSRFHSTGREDRTVEVASAMGDEDDFDENDDDVNDEEEDEEEGDNEYPSSASNNRYHQSQWIAPLSQRQGESLVSGIHESTNTQNLHHLLQSQLSDRSIKFLEATGLSECLEQSEVDPRIWKESPQSFAKVAVTLYQIGQQDLADRCTERLVILASGQKKSLQQAHDWLKLLTSKDSRIWPAYRQNIESSQSQLRHQAHGQSLVTGTDSSVRQNSFDERPDITVTQFGPRNSGTSVHGSIYINRLSDTPPILTPPQFITRFSQGSDQYATPPGFGAYQESHSAAPSTLLAAGQGSRSPLLHTNRGSFSSQGSSRIPRLQNLSVNDSGNDDTISEATYDAYGDPAIAAISKWSIHGNVSDLQIRGQDLHSGPRSPALKGLPAHKQKELWNSYKVKSGMAAEQFYVVGRVFAMLWHENAGINDKPNQSEHTKDADKPFHTVGAFGEKIFSHIRRFAVVKRRRGHFWAIPIGSYGGKALTHKNMNVGEVRAHAVVYASGTKAIKYKGEEDIDKTATAIDLKRGQHLNPQSRINFAKPQSIEWNIKTMEVGMVAKASMAYFKGALIAEAMRD